MFLRWLKPGASESSVGFNISVSKALRFNKASLHSRSFLWACVLKVLASGVLVALRNSLLAAPRLYDLCSCCLD